MPISTDLTALLGIRHPVLLAPMDTISGSRLTRAVSEAGGFGILGGGYGDRARLEAETAKLNDFAGPFGIGFITWSLAKQPELLDIALHANPRAVMLSFGDPAPFAPKIKAAGALLICQVQSEDMARQAARVATKPLLLSHTALSGSRAMGPTPLAGRQVTPDHARAIAETGGSVGIWHFFPSLDRYVEGLKEMADAVGVEHVSIGTDQFDARGCLEAYTRWVHLVAAMLRGGFTAEEAGKIAGGNYMRIFRAAVG